MARRLSYGHYVEWTGTFSGYERKDRRLLLTIDCKGAKANDYFEVVLPFTFMDPVKKLRKDDPLRFRGVIVLCGSVVELNYADFEKLATS